MRSGEPRDLSRACLPFPVLESRIPIRERSENCLQVEQHHALPPFLNQCLDMLDQLKAPFEKRL